MGAIIVSIGEELLTGQKVNTNAVWIASQLNLAGIEVLEIRVVTDHWQEIMRTLQEAYALASLVLITGGLGPTNDDMTRDVLCRFFDARLVLNEQVLDDIKGYLGKRGRSVTELNRDQAMVPDKADIIRNICGTAPGMWFKKDGKDFIALPGVPYEMKEMVRGHVLPALMIRPRKQYIIHKTVLTHGIGESQLAEHVAGWEKALPKTMQLAYLPSTGIVKLRLTARGPEEGSLHEAIAAQVKQLAHLIPRYIWGFDDDTLEGLTGRLLKEQGKTVSAAESCTGGTISHKITSVPGSSAYFKGSIVAYDNQVKESLLGVPFKTLEAQGAVSREVAEAMALGARNVFRTDYAIGVTGIAGPAGGTKTKPVGTTWIAVAGKHKVTSRHFVFGDNRERNTIMAANAALAMLKSFITGE